MKIKKYVLSFFILLIIILIILNPQNNMTNLFNGLSVWSTCVIPALFPFLFFTKLLLSLEVIEKFSKIFSPFTKRLYNVSGVSGYIYVMSIMSGYPLSASMIADFYDKKVITKYEATRICSFTSTSGPLFIIGTIAIGMCGNFKMGIMILTSHFLGAILNGLLYRNYGKKKENLINNKINIFTKNQKNTMEDAMLSSIKSILIIGGYISLSFLIIGILNDFGIIKILSKFLSCCIGIDYNIINSFLNGLVEVTKGGLDLSQLNLNNDILAMLLTGIISFGGFSIILQALNFLRKAEIKISIFLLQKTTQSVISVLICFLLTLIF